jgi:hypothetical protein
VPLKPKQNRPALWHGAAISSGWRVLAPPSPM